MSSEYIVNCTKRALSSIQKLKDEGKEVDHLEISSDVWLMINLGGFNMFPGKKIFAGLNVQERRDLTDHILAIPKS